MEVLAIWIIITELPNINMIVTFTKRVQIQLRDRSLFMWGGKIMGWARPIFFREKGWAKENFTIIGGGSLCVL